MYVDLAEIRDKKAHVKNTPFLFISKHAKQLLWWTLFTSSLWAALCFTHRKILLSDYWDTMMPAERAYHKQEVKLISINLSLSKFVSPQACPKLPGQLTTVHSLANV